MKPLTVTNYEVGDKVEYRDYQQWDPKWVPGVVTDVVNEWDFVGDYIVVTVKLYNELTVRLPPVLQRFALRHA
jgi:hypothetical protein